jgi:hypothetical protein
MSSVSLIGAVSGFVIIVVTVRQIATRGIPKNDGSVDGVNSYDLSQGRDGFPPGHS